MIRDFFNDLLKYIPSQILPSLIKLFSIPIVTRLFLPTVYGDYILVVTTFTILSYSVSWVNIAVIRFYAKHSKENTLDTFYATVLAWSAISLAGLTPVFFCLLFLVGSHVSSSFMSLMVIGFVDFFISSFFWLFMELMRAKRAAFFYSMLSMIDSIFSLFIALVLILFFKFGIWSFFAGSILSVGLSLMYILFVKRKSIFKISLRSSSKELAQSMVKYSIPVVIGNLTYWVLALSDRYVIGLFRGAREVGVYSASYAIGEKTIMFLAVFFSFVATPIAMAIWEKDGIEKSKEFTSELTRYFLLFAIPAAVGLSVLAKPIIRIFTSPNYYSGYIILPWVASSIVLYGLFDLFGNGLAFYKKNHYLMWCVMIAGTVNIILNLIFVPKLGYYAAAWSTFVGYVCLLSLMVYFSRKFFRWKFPFMTLAKSALASGIMALLIYAFWPHVYFFNDYINVFMYILFGVGVYFSGIVLLGEVTPSEKNVALSFIRKFFT